MDLLIFTGCLFIHENWSVLLAIGFNHNLQITNHNRDTDKFTSMSIKYYKAIKKKQMQIQSRQSAKSSVALSVLLQFTAFKAFFLSKNKRHENVNGILQIKTLTRYNTTQCNNTRSVGNQISVWIQY